MYQRIKSYQRAGITWGNPLYLDVLAAVQGTPFEHIQIHSGRYGLGSKDTTPADIVSVFHNRDKSVFTVGILDDVTHLSLERKEEINVLPEGTVSCKFWGLGSDGTVGANKNSIKIIGDNTELFAQAYFEYDSQKIGWRNSIASSLWKETNQSALYGH